MELLVTRQPWNLLIFMAVPVIRAETAAITEIAVLFNRAASDVVRNLNRVASIVAGLWFTRIFIYLITQAVLPTTRGRLEGAGILPLAVKCKARPISVAMLVTLCVLATYPSTSTTAAGSAIGQSRVD